MHLQRNEPRRRGEKAGSATMFRLSLVFMAGLWAAGAAGAGTWTDGLFDDLSKDFGSVPRGPTLKHHFRLVNRTMGPINIASVRVSCGCLTATVARTFP